MFSSSFSCWCNFSRNSGESVSASVNSRGGNLSTMLVRSSFLVDRLVTRNRQSWKKEANNAHDQIDDKRSTTRSRDNSWVSFSHVARCILPSQNRERRKRKASDKMCTTYIDAQRRKKKKKEKASSKLYRKRKNRFLSLSFSCSRWVYVYNPATRLCLPTTVAIAYVYVTRRFAWLSCSFTKRKENKWHGTTDARV